MTKKFSFSKNERLYKKLLIDQLFTKGMIIYYAPFRIYFMVINEPLSSPVQVLISVPKRNFKQAVKRNRIKRLIKEVYRINKSLLYKCMEDINKSLALGIIYSNASVPDYNYIAEKLPGALKKVESKIEINKS